MSRLSRLVLSSIAVFFIAALFNPAVVAAKSEKQMMIQSIPIAGMRHGCSVVWHDPAATGGTLSVTVTIRGTYGEEVYTDQSLVSDVPYGFPGDFFGVAYCIVEWFGRPGEVQASLCGVSNYGSGCVALE